MDKVEPPMTKKEIERVTIAVIRLAETVALILKKEKVALTQLLEKGARPSEITPILSAAIKVGQDIQKGNIVVPPYNRNMHQDDLITEAAQNNLQELNELYSLDCLKNFKLTRKSDRN